MAQKHTPGADEVQKEDETAQVRPDELNKETTIDDTSEPENQADISKDEDVKIEDASDNQDTKNTFASSESAAVVSMHQSKGRRFLGWIKGHKKSSVVAIVVLVLVVLGAVPITRYAIAGLVLKHTVTVELTDAQTHQPVSSAKVSFGSVSASTDGQGKATLRVPVGSKILSVAKNYYQPVSEKVVVPIGAPQPFAVKLVATGRQVPVMVTDKISGKPVEGVTIKALDTDAKTDKDGHATIVLPAGKQTVPATLSCNGCNSLTATIQVTAAQVTANNFSMTPSGSIYFLSNLSGKIDVVKTSLDGSGRQTIVAGTGKEDPNNTVLLASRDWKYLALLANRDGTQKLYLITTATGALTTMDEGANVTFTLDGWSNDTFIYTVARGGVQNWQPGQYALKSFNATSQKLATLDQSAATGTSADNYIGESFGAVYILSDNEIVYTKNFGSAYYSMYALSNQQSTLNSINADGSNKKVIKSFGIPAGSGGAQIYINVWPDEPDSLYVAAPFTNPTQYYEYEDGQLKSAPTVTDQTVNNGYATYLLSPSGTQTFWSEPRDGKNALFVGDGDANNQKQIASLSDYQTYGWYSDKYLLVSKNSSELYIMPVSGSAQPLKVSDYYKPPFSYRGYGGGYGGL